VPVLAKAVRDVELAVERGRPRASTRSTFQAVALLVREERTRLQAQDVPEGRRNEQLKRLDGIATSLARTAARDGTLLTLLTEDAQVLPDTRALLREMRLAGGLELPAAEDAPDVAADTAPARTERQVVPRSVISRQLANPFLEPDFSAPPPPPRARLLATWELLGPLLRAFERASGGAPSCMTLPAPSSLRAAAGRELMPHQAQVVAAPPTGTAPSCSPTSRARQDRAGAARRQAADAYPLLAVVPNVVKTNWAREAQLWTPERAVTVVHGDGRHVDAFSDIVVVNYEVLDRHVGWFGTFGFRGMVVDEAHFIKNKTSQRSQHVLELSERIRWRTSRPLLMALTGTPLINDIDDFLAIWQFLGWIDDDEPSLELMGALERNGLTRWTPTSTGRPRSGHRPRHRAAAQGRRRRRHPRPPHRGPAGGARRRRWALDPGGRARAGPPPGQALPQRARGARPGVVHTGVDAALVRRVAGWERQEAKETQDSENVFSMMRRIGQAKAVPPRTTPPSSRAAPARSCCSPSTSTSWTPPSGPSSSGASATCRCAATRAHGAAGEHRRLHDDPTSPSPSARSPRRRRAQPAGRLRRGARELSWTDAEQTQAIDRVHRIGQDKPVTAWRIIAAQTIDARIAELLDEKAGLAARALDGSDDEVARRPTCSSRRSSPC
jgi:hypothetical protein